MLHPSYGLAMEERKSLPRFYPFDDISSGQSHHSGERQIMDHLTQVERDELSRKRFYAIPMSLVIEAQKYAVSIDETCIQALKHKIQEKKELLSVATFLKEKRSLQHQ